MKLAAFLLMVLACGPVMAASITLPGLCPGYRLAVARGVLTVYNGRCVNRGWETLRIVNMCRGQRFGARTGSLGNLYVYCQA